ncbi:MAG: GDSL-type esterase/lipase family protein, partial [Desulfovibrio sp.]
MIITCLGDSLTYGYGVGRPQTWCALASALTGHDFVNRGVNGALSDEIAAQPLGGDEVFALGGLNDLFMGREVRVPLEQMRLLCRRASDAGIRPTVGIPMQIAPDVDEAWCDGPVDIARV